VSVTAPAVAAELDSMLYQASLSKALASIRTVLQRRQLDPLRYTVDIDAGLPVFAPRSMHMLRVSYNRQAALAMEIAIPHDWLMAESGKPYEDFLVAVDDLILALKGRVQVAGCRI
jgi:hypothetical protein